MISVLLHGRRENGRKGGGVIAPVSRCASDNVVVDSRTVVFAKIEIKRKRKYNTFLL